MPRGELLESKRAPLGRALTAVAMIGAIVLVVAGTLHYAAESLESHFHLFDKAHEAGPGALSPHPGIFLLLLSLYPVLSLLGLLLVIPLLVYMTDYAPFQSLRLWKPNHYARLVRLVYSAWLKAPGGKLEAKEL